MKPIATILGLDTPANEHSARARLTTLWLVMLTLNVLVVLLSYLLQAFGPLRDPATQAALLKALDAVFFVFAANVTAICTYWFALRDDTTAPLRSLMAFRISWFSSILWGLIITVVHFFGGASTYESGLQTLSVHGGWLVSGALAFYFASGKRGAASSSGRRKRAIPPQG
jgi:hypothetical protein